MIHFSCDRCKRVIGEDELRFVVRLEVHAAMDGLEDGDADENERDYLLELHEILERCEHEPDEPIGDEVFHRSRYDLCQSCYKRFLKDPLGAEPVKQLDFSQN